MAYKNAYGVNGYLTAPLPASPSATMIQLDAGLSALLRQLLSPGDWTFLLVGFGTTAELVLVNYSATNDFVVARAQDGSILRTHAAGDTAVFSVCVRAVADEATPALPTPTGTGLVSVDLSQGLLDPKFSVAPPQFAGHGLSITGTWPAMDFTVTADDTGCCGGGGGGGSGSGVVLTGGGLVSVDAGTGAATITVAPPNFDSLDGSVGISGVWPDLDFTAFSSGGGSVASVTAGAGIVITGTPTSNPTVGLTTSGVVAGAYGSITVNAYGQLTAIDASFNPPSTIGGAAPITVVTTGHAITITIEDAAEGTKGAVALADADSPLDATDHATAVNPALLASVINSLAGAEVTGFTSWSAEPTGLYTNVVSGAPVLLDIPADVKAVVRACVTMVNTGSPTSAVAFGIGIFDTAGPTLIQGNRSISQCSQSMEIIIDGPFSSSLALVSTAIPAGASVVSSSLTVVTY